MLKKTISLFLVLLLFACFSTANGATRKSKKKSKSKTQLSGKFLSTPIFGFDIGINFFSMPSDSRFTATSKSFSVYFPFGRDLILAYYKEENSLTMEDAGATQAGSLDINELRIYVDSGSLGPVSADFFIGIGGANININTAVPATTIQENQPVTDIGFKFNFMENKTSLLTSTISAELALRKLTPTSTVVIGTDPVKDLGGINIGINVALMF